MMDYEGTRQYLKTGLMNPVRREKEAACMDVMNNYDKDSYGEDSRGEDFYGEDFYGSEELDLYVDADEIAVHADSEMSADDAFVYCMNEKGYVDLAYMSAISGLDTDDLIDELSGKAICPDPAVYEVTEDYEGCFTTVQQYLKGNLIHKYEAVKRINDRYGLFHETEELLRKALPDAVEPEDIHINLGASWIPEKYVASFIRFLLESVTEPRVEYNEYMGKWTVDMNTPPDYVKNNYEYGTIRMPAVNIIRHALNAKSVKVYDQVPSIVRDRCDSVLNKQETLAAQQKLKLILDCWQDFVHGNPDIERHLYEIYMDSYGYSLCRYDGSFLKLPGLNPDIKPYKHQLNAIARIVLNHNTLLAHEVGAGKTMEYVCGVHELIRMGLGHKALIVLPNTTLDSAVNIYKELYADDRILAVYPRQHFTPAERSETLEKMKGEEYQVIFMAYSSFDMLTLSPEYSFRKKEQQIRECKLQIDLEKRYSTKRALEREMKKLRKAADKYREDFNFDETACFDKLGIDILVVDEAHNYKNITLDNNTDSIVGVHNTGSKKADNMLEKVEYIQSVHGYVIFATGTPITNSMADLYVLQRYLQPEELKFCSIFHFNDWINTFASQTHSFEIDVDSKNYRYTTRFSKFHNLPEMMSMFSNVCDFYQISNGELGLPEFDGYTDILVRKSEEQKEYIDNLAERTENIRAHEVSRREDNLLLITVDGRKCALDIRLVNPEANVCDDDTKVGACARQMAKLYFEYPQTTQIAFSDISTPKEEFNIYDELKMQLMKLGIPGSEIMFIHEAKTEAQRTRLEKAFNEGKIRILIGSTMKLGTGVNVQERLLAIHHLDVPWRPADMVQREGRIIRQGNTNDRVYVYRYCTEASFDAYTWQILENKQRFIAQFLSGSLSSVHRDESDCADTVLSYAEIKALAIGNPLIKERVEAANELEHAKINYRQKRKELLNLQELLGTLPTQIAKRTRLLRNAKADRIAYKKNRQPVTMEERKMFGEELLYALAHNIMKEKERVFETYQSFDVILPKRMKSDKRYVVLRRGNSNIYTVEMGEKPMGCSKRLDYFLDHLDDTVRSHEAALKDLYNQKKNAEKSLADGNEFESEVDRLTAKIAAIDEQLEEDKAS